MNRSRTQIPREEWSDFFDVLSSELAGDGVTIELVSPDLGDQIEAEDATLQSIQYDPGDDVIVVNVDATESDYDTDPRRTVNRPQEVYADPGLPGLDYALDIIDDDGVQTILTLRRRPALTAD